MACGRRAILSKKYRTKQNQVTVNGEFAATTEYGVDLLQPSAAERPSQVGSEFNELYSFYTRLFSCDLLPT